MQLTFLGTGTSQGVPMIGCGCEVCRSDDPRDKRGRSSVLIQNDGECILVDTPPEFRAQAIREGVSRIDAVIITHAHADHVMGFDDLRQVYEKTRSKIPVYAFADTMKRLAEVFYYAFNSSGERADYLRVTPHEVNGPFRIGSLQFIPFALPHGPMISLGFLVEKDGRKRLAYLNDCAKVSDEIAGKIQDVPVLILDGLRDDPHPTHMTVAQAIEVSRRVRAKKTFLTHLTHEKTFVAREKEMPEGCFISYDGLKLEI